MLSEDWAVKLLKESGTPNDVIEHCKTVHDTALNVCDLLKERNNTLKINRRFIGIASLLHDIGRSKSHSIDHGLVGADIIRGLNTDENPELEKIARVCETHVGAGIGPKEAKKLGLPKRDYIPKTIEEKIIAYADNMVDGNEVRSPKWCAIRFEKKFGKNSDVTKRVVALNHFFEDLLA